MRETKINKTVTSQDTLNSNTSIKNEAPQQDTLKTKPKLFYEGMPADSTTAGTGTTAQQQPVTVPVASDLDIKGSVGRNGVNNPEDVAKVEAKLKELGIYSDGCDLAEAIMEFQRYALKRATPDGRIDPGGPTLSKLKTTDAAGYEAMKTEYLQEEERKKNAEKAKQANAQVSKPVTTPPNNAATVQKPAQTKAAIDKEAQDLINKHTSYGNLDEEGLGKELARMAVSKPDTVTRVLDLLGSTDRDDVASETVSNMHVKDLLGASKALLQRLYNELDNGWTTDQEYTQMKTLKLAMGQKIEKEETGASANDSPDKIGPVLTDDQFVSQHDLSNPKVACKRACDAMLKNAGVTTSSSQAIQTLLEVNGENQVTEKAADGIAWLDKELMAGHPVMVGVDHTLGTTYNGDHTTDHFVVIVEKNIDDKEKIYYRFFDPGSTKESGNGISQKNRFYISSDNSLVSTTTHVKGKDKYTVAQIRKNNETK